MEEECDFGKLLKQPCNKTHYTRKSGVKKLNALGEDAQKTLLWRAGLTDTANKDDLTICLHHEKVFGEVFERKMDKCCAILKKHKKKVQGKKIL